MNKLREHMRTLHPRVKLPRSNEDLAKAHMRDHHYFAPTNHRHEGANRGPGDRPEGWRTGEGVVITP